MAEGSISDLKFYQVDAKKSLTEVTVILDKEYFQLKIENLQPRPTTPTIPTSPNRTSWSSFRSFRSFSRSWSSGSSTRNATRNDFVSAGVIPLVEVKELRTSAFNSKVLLNGKRHNGKFKQVTILVGKEFNLKPHAYIAEVNKDGEGPLEEWIHHLQDLVLRSQSLSYFDQLNLWYLKEFRMTLAKSTDNHRLKSLKQLLNRCHHRTTTEALSIDYGQFETRLREGDPSWCSGSLRKPEFDTTVRHFLHSPHAISHIFDPLSAYNLTEQGDILTLLGDCKGNELDAVIKQYPSLHFVVDAVKNYFLHFKGDNCGELPEAQLDDASPFTKDLLRKLAEHFQTTEVKFVLEEKHLNSQLFLDYLFCEKNSIWDPKYEKVFQDMSHPLSHYWIASSHNTYLTGDQYSSLSSVECYARALRQGCRCIEIDVFNGPNCSPIVKHGMTLTTSVRLKDVLLTIKEHAFATTCFPLIISIENHCNLKQQKKMAKLFRKIFGRMLIDSPLPQSTSDGGGGAGQQLPSPEQLRNRILLKGKKLKWAVYEEVVEKEPEPEPERSMFTEHELRRFSDNAKASNEPNPSCDCLMTGELLKKNDSGQWIRCIFVLTNKKLLYVEKTENNNVGLGGGQPSNYLKHQEGDYRKSVVSVESACQDLHVDQPWFHGKIPGGRTTAAELLEGCGVTGTFLVRASDSKQGSFVVSFFGNGKTYECRILQKMTNEKEPMFHLKSEPTEEEIFSSFYELIEYYKCHPLKIPDYNLERLVQPVPPSTSHECEDWFYKDMDRVEAEKVLEKLPINGAFLSRYRTDNRGEIVISFRIANVIKHCHIKREGRYLTVSNLRFLKLETMVEHYKNKPFYKDIKLTHPVGERLLKECQRTDWATRVYGDPEYLNSTVKTVKGRVRAIQSYTSEEPDLLSFRKGEIIVNVEKEADGWWSGTKQDSCEEDSLVPKQFCSSFVEEIEELDCPFGDVTCRGEVKLGIEAKVKLCKDLDGMNNGIKYYIQFKEHDGTKRKLGAACSKRKVNEWVDFINHVVDRDREGKIKLAKLRAAAKHNIAPEFSDLIIYCCGLERLVPDEIGMDKDKVSSTSVKSFDELTGDREFRNKPSYFVWYHEHAMTRVYPKGLRLDSSNVNPARFWNCGSQMVALNYQTGDKSMQLNRGKFRQNGNCGYVLKPEFMISQAQGNERFDPIQVDEDDSSSLFKSLYVRIEVIAARHLQKEGLGPISPLVEIEVVGVDADCTKTKTPPCGTGFNPCWNHKVGLKIRCPDLALIQFRVCDVDTFSDKVLLGETAIPVNCMREGYRSIQLNNAFGEPLFSTLLVKVVKRNNSAFPISPTMPGRFSSFRDYDYQKI